MSIKTTIIVLYVRPGELPDVVEIEDTTAAMQRLVGGYLDVIRLPNGIDVWCNDEAFMAEDPHVNFVLGGVPIFGDVFFACHDGRGNAVSITPTDAEHLAAFFLRERTARESAS